MARSHKGDFTGTASKQTCKNQHGRRLHYMLCRILKGQNTDKSTRHLLASLASGKQAPSCPPRRPQPAVGLCSQRGRRLGRLGTSLLCAERRRRPRPRGCLTLQDHLGSLEPDVALKRRRFLFVPSHARMFSKRLPGHLSLGHCFSSQCIS